ncbi:hypothetical protein HDA39_001240 [Kribbella italica]|uniref:1-phosphatidylinositol phosphodiesterase n=1 Tax=Kribbella italica TaxID=1540520 RepID=A0A7W9J2K6_9ACTN|nr:hypothetical protein [Kribbella italica]
MTTLAITTSSLVLSAGTASANDHYSSIESAAASNVDWMSRVPGDVTLDKLSVPGTHDSLALCGISGEDGSCEAITTSITKTQENHGYSAETLTTQLTAGIRALDIRVRVDKGEAGVSFTVHHGAFYQRANFADVLTKVRAFLAAHPRETILLHLKAECTGEAGSCSDAGGYGNDEWRRKTLRSYLEGKAYTGNGDESNPATNWSSLFWAPSVTGDSQADTPKLSETRGKIVLAGYRGVRGGIYSGYGLKVPYPGGGSNDEWVQDDYQVSDVSSIDDKWEKVRTHLRRTNGVWDLTRPGEKEHVHQPDSMYVNYTSGTGSGAHPFTVAGGTPTVTGVNEFLIQCLRGSSDRCPEFYPGRDEKFGGQPSMTRTGVIMMDFPGGGLIDEIVERNPTGPDPVDDNGRTFRGPR